MKLTFDEIKRVTAGALRMTEESDGIHFFRCTEKQIASWDAIKSEFKARALCTTGVRLDFHTNSKHLAFSASSGSKFEIYVDGTFRKLVRMDKGRESGEIPTIDLCDPLGNEKDEVRVTLCFPAHSCGVLSFVELDDGATIRPHEFNLKMLFIGDSITQGWQSSHDSFAYVPRVTAHFDAETVNQGIGGAFYHESCFDSLPFSPDVVVVSYGTNDFGRYKTYDELRLHAKKHLSLIANEYADKKIFVISPIWRDKREGKAMGTFEGCRAIIKEEAEALSLNHVDGLYLVPPLPEFFGDEYLHPNDLGFSFYAENLIRVLSAQI